jgi:phosphoglycolate phosphatase
MANNLIACDFDGTINRIDIGKVITKALLPSEWQKIESAFKNNELNNFMLYHKYVLPALNRNNFKIEHIINKNLKIAPGFKEFFEKMTHEGNKIIVLSDGFDVYIEAFIKKYKLNIEYYSNRLIYSEKHQKYSIINPNHCYCCTECGTCKTKVIRKIKNQYQNIIYVGDGDSDICASLQSNIFFGKRKVLLKIQQIDSKYKPALFYLYNFNNLTNQIENLNKVRCVIFDLDGTLVDGFDIIYESFNYALKKLGLKTVPISKIRKVIGPALSEGFRRLVPNNLVEKGVQLYREYYKERYLKKTILFDGIRELLTMLKDRNIIIGLITNKKGNFAKDLLEYLNLIPYFDFIKGAEEGFLPKPESQIIEHILRLYNLKPNEVVYIGDSSIDGEFANKAGVKFLAVGMGLGKEQELYKYKPLSFCLNTKDLINILNKIVLL